MSARDEAVEMIRRICPAHLDRDQYGALLAEKFDAHRAAVLREAADALDNSERLREITDDHMRDINEAADELRRMADETQQDGATS